MRKIGLLLTCLVMVLTTKAQDHDWAFGFYGDVQLKAPNYNGAFGIQGKYDFTAHSAAQAQVYGRHGYVAAGLDYLFSLLDKEQSNFNIFLGAGYSQDFYKYNEFSGEIVIPERRENHSIANGQLGVSYYFPEVNVSVYAGYKAKYNFDWDEFNPNFVMFGLRYHLW
ncbi:hypothetical protein PQ465_16865 [Sphingobacterium oryzagri]|uniref:Outer membrane protein beta-barrel domain-containing protein n=1 Tax=Sphingobacterium oryzagri TaxID=3025669 RepID=A0ABY7WI47_9SPHI|nr:hypothetical protein [Sphingobacterium sp. KACC 22765]WDF67960.1 hypothetical protein PQ465_16865 [Sphingobacterium sp. KACC 22765]